MNGGAAAREVAALSASAACPTAISTAAVEFALDATVIPAIPTLPQRSPAEGMIVQAVVGHPRHHRRPVRQRSRSTSAASIPTAPVTTDLQHDAFGGFRAFLAAAAGRLETVKWQFVGPVTLGHRAAARRRARATSAFEWRSAPCAAHVQHLLDARRRGAARMHAGGVHRRARHGRPHRPVVPASRPTPRSTSSRARWPRSRHGRSRDCTCAATPTGPRSARAGPADPVDPGARLGAGQRRLPAASSSTAAASSRGAPCPPTARSR